MTTILLYSGSQGSSSLFYLWGAGILSAVILIVLIVRQIRAGKALAQELEELEQARQNNIEYEFVLKAMKLATWQLDPHKRTVSYENDFREGSGNYISVEGQPLSISLRQILPAYADKVAEALDEICSGRTDFYHQEYQAKSSAGDIYWEESYATIAARDEQGMPTKIVGTSMRVDSRKELEASLVTARNKAEESDRLKTAFLANMGHEIRTPLNAIVGFADLLPVVQSEEDRNQLIDEIQTNNRKLLRIIDGLVSMSKIEAGAKSLLLAEIDLNQVLEQLAETYRPTTNVEILTHFQLPKLMMRTDREKLLEILDNLLQNAVKFTTEGSITICYELEGNQVKVLVSDTGKGIDQADQQRIFERFVKVDEYVPGTGLGLSVVKSHVENLGGSVGVESAPGVGSTFWFILPLAEQ